MRNGSHRKNGTKRKIAERPIAVEAGSGNVFADLGIPNPHIALAKAELVQHIRQLIADRKLTQSQAADLLGIDQPKVSALIRGRVEGYTIDRLIRFLNALGQCVQITIRPATKASARSFKEPPVVVS